MTPPAKPDPGPGESLLDRLATEDPARLDVASDAQVEGMMDAAGVVIGEPESVEDTLGRGERRARHRPGTSSAPPPSVKRSRPPPRSRPPTLWIAGAMLALGTGTLLVTQGSGLVARFKGGPDDVGPGRPEMPPGSAQQATTLREQAFTACDAQLWTACADKLDEARRLDPAGEGQPRVTAARGALAGQAAGVPRRGATQMPIEGHQPPPKPPR